MNDYRLGPSSATGESGHQDLHDKEMRKREAYYKKQKEEQKIDFIRGHKDRVRHSDMHKAAEELRMEGKGSEDPAYVNSKKNK